ncbi:afadin- and alpha-actinin-binding protein-like isoform X3 [Denticeps clupeoides]|uniref:afadin- and alpha-actinin-binding protein-like isoform X3 n=1 Tax=Denticeps clupeoides TaxID=299321 RepID=UPI0010A34F4A|nr:afadin- and alpha-actinin-binding protein-like isoform X3 [Denticeps clupeoides]
MPESSQENMDGPYNSYRLTPLLRRYTQSTNFYSPLKAFCTDENMAECISFLNEMSLLGFPLLCPESGASRGLDVVALLNSMHALVQQHRQVLRTVENLETEQLRAASDMEYQQLSHARLKEQFELAKRENGRLQERERQLHMNIKSLQNCIKNEKEEVQKLQNIRASRAAHYSHDKKRKEREYQKLKEHLNQVLVDRKDKKQAIEILNCVGRSDGKRSQWKTRKSESRHESEMYKILLNELENRQKELMTENAELRKVLQQMKKEMVGILGPKRSSLGEPRCERSADQESASEGEGDCDPGQKAIEVSCEHAREELTNSIRQQWRKIKHHVEKLDCQVSLVQVVQVESEAASNETNDQEMGRLKLEVQQCKEFIHTQQQLLQQQLISPCEEETASLLKDCYVLEEKERFKEQRRIFEEQRKNFASERQNFTEAAIRLGHERKMFEEDRATWLKHHFLNLTFTDHVTHIPKSPGLPAEYVEPDPKTLLSPVTFSDAGSVKSSATADFHQALLPQSRF